MATSFKPIKARAYTFNVGLVDAAAVTKLKASPTLAAGDFKISIDGGAFANLATLPTVTPAGGVGVKISLSAAEMTGDNIVIACIDAAGAEWCDQMIELCTQDLSFAAFHFVMRDTSGNPATGKTVTATRVIDTGTFSSGTIGAVTEIANGLYRVVYPAADANATDCVSMYYTATGCMPTLITLTNK